VQDEAERYEADAQGDLEFTLLQMQGETLSRIEEALDSLDAGRYGVCADCACVIAIERLQALPFATRCRRCEQIHETKGGDHPPVSNWRQTLQLFRRSA
jgi:DnaK suppressor protein